MTVFHLVQPSPFTNFVGPKVITNAYAAPQGVNVRLKVGTKSARVRPPVAAVSVD